MNKKLVRINILAKHLVDIPDEVFDLDVSKLARQDTPDSFYVMVRGSEVEQAKRVINNVGLLVGVE